MVCLLFYQQVH
uniref:Uncharacterized protein n=1 Tax=Arundo donax TaxID=35708 RepID=A0A0A9GSU3_ARUDO